MRVLIVDDEPAARERLALILEELDVEVVGQAADGLEAVRLITERRPDVVLLDVVIPELDGLDVARHAGGPPPWIVFQTAHAGYAVRAFEEEALDFVVKPVSLKRLEVALQRVQRRLDAGAHSGQAARDVLERLAPALAAAGTPARRSRVLVRDGAGLRVLPFSEILLFRADAGDAVAVTAQGRFSAAFSLAELERRTAGTFVRANRNELVNSERVDRIDVNDQGVMLLTLAGGHRVRVSRRRTADVRKAFG